MDSLKKQILKGILQAGLMILTIFSTLIFITIVLYLAQLFDKDGWGALVLVAVFTFIWNVLILISRPIFLLKKVRKGKYLDFDKRGTYFYIFRQYMFFYFVYLWISVFIYDWLFYYELFIVLGIIVTALTNIKPSKILLVSLILHFIILILAISEIRHNYLIVYVFIYYLVNVYIRQCMTVYYTSFLKKAIKEGGTIKEKKDLILNIFLEMIPTVILGIFIVIFYYDYYLSFR